jgi:glycosyltransferase involved in cell wall biosynthesis
MPKVSIICRAYNQEKWIGLAIKSALNQTFTDFELLITNDASSDKTWEKINEFNDDRIVKLNNSRNIGALQSLKKCLEISKGEYITILDGDDEFVFSKLEKQVKFLDENLDFGAVFSYINPIGDNNNPNHIRDIYNFRKMINNPQVSRAEMLRKCFSSNTFLAFPSEMFRRNIDFSWPDNILGLGETNFHITMLLKTNIKIIEEELINYRVSDDYSNKWCNYLSLKSELYFILDRFLEIDDIEFFKEIFKHDLKNINVLSFNKDLIAYILTLIAENEDDKIEWANYNLHRFIKNPKNYSLLINELNLDYKDFILIKNGGKNAEKKENAKKKEIKKFFGIFRKKIKSNGKTSLYLLGIKVFQFKKKLN